MITLVPGNRPRDPAAISEHLVASRTVLSNCLASFFPGIAHRRPPESQPPTRAHGPDSKEVYGGPGFVAGADRHISCQRDESAFWIDISTLGTFNVDAGGSTVFLTESEADQAATSEAALGPALMLALALQGVYSLHASAVAVTVDNNDGCVAFLGTSGAGKSTVARLLDRHDPPCRRTADDILPLVHLEHGFQARLDFPQPKLSFAEQAQARQPSALPLRAIYCLVPGGGEVDTASAIPMDGADGAVELLRFTVASKLFDQQLRSHHLGWCAKVAESVPMWQLRYPWNGASTEAIHDVITNTTTGVKR